MLDQGVVLEVIEHLWLSTDVRNIQSCTPCFSLFKFIPVTLIHVLRKVPVNVEPSLPGASTTPVQCQYYTNLVQHLSGGYAALEGPHMLSTGNVVTDVCNIQSCTPYFSLFKSIPVTLIHVIYDCHA